METCVTICLTKDKRVEKRTLMLPQNTVFDEKFSLEGSSFEEQKFEFLYSAFAELNHTNFHLQLISTLITQFKCGNSVFEDSQHESEMRAPELTDFFPLNEVIWESTLTRFYSGRIASDNYWYPTIELSLLFQQIRHKSFTYEEWKHLIQKYITDWKFLDRGVPATVGEQDQGILCNQPCDQSPQRTELNRLVEEMDRLEAMVDSVELAFQNLEQNVRRNWLVLHGVYEKEQENTLEVMMDVVKVKTGLQINPQDVENCHRMGRRRYRSKADPAKMQQNKRPIVIKFVNYCKRKALWDHKKHLRGSGLLLTESLTNTRLELLQTARDLFGEKSVWSQDGRIMYRKPDGSKLRINSLDDLKAISNVL